ARERLHHLDAEAERVGGAAHRPLEGNLDRASEQELSAGSAAHRHRALVLPIHDDLARLDRLRRRRPPLRQPAPGLAVAPRPAAAGDRAAAAGAELDRAGLPRRPGGHLRGADGHLAQPRRRADDAARHRRETFTWLLLAVMGGVSAGAALAGPLVEAGGWRSAVVPADAAPLAALPAIFAGRHLLPTAQLQHG